MWVSRESLPALVHSTRKWKLWSSVFGDTTAGESTMISIKTECSWSWILLGRGPEGLFLPTLVHAKLPHMLSSCLLRMKNRMSLRQKKSVYVYVEKCVFGPGLRKTQVQVCSSVLIRGKSEGMKLFPPPSLIPDFTPNIFSCHY